ncbi:MAG: cupredoxin domain-containing protein [Pyrinomonadaceae bacterium]
MKKQMMRSLVAASMMLAMLFGGNAILGNGTPDKTKIDAKAAAKHPKTVRVTVGKNGFSPSSIRTEEGSPLTLIFTRKDRQGCGSKVVFPSLGITRNLPVGKPVTIKFTPEQTGDIAFACGMGMHKGNIVAY